MITIRSPVWITHSLSTNLQASQHFHLSYPTLNEAGLFLIVTRFSKLMRTMLLMPSAVRSLLILAIALMSVLDAQIDERLCPDGPITSIDPSWPLVPERFEILAELVEAHDVAELSQAFSLQRDSIAFTLRGREYSVIERELRLMKSLKI